jgi:sugar (pentulose or hexulose) kinase
MLFDINKFEWSESISEQLELPIEKLPHARPSGTMIGEVSITAAEVTGLKAGTPVLAGGGDQQCAALGLGVIREGLVKATTGTGTFVLGHLKQPKFDPNQRVICSVSIIPHQWVLEASIFTTGAVYRWFRDNMAEIEKLNASEQDIDVYELLNRKVESAEPGAHGLIVLPHFSGAGAPYWNPNAKGMIYGLTLAHKKNDILRAILEGICFEVKKSIEIFGELGVNINDLRIAGGATRAEVWNQMQADIYGIPVSKTAYEETTALGAAIIGCVGCKIYSSYHDAVESMVELKRTYQPNSELKQSYDDQFNENKRLYNKLSNNFKVQ